MKYYHITDVKNVISILEKGLLLNQEGELFLFDDRKISGCIAYNQLGLSDFALFEIDSTLDFIQDIVSEITSSHQWISKKPIEKVKFVGCFKLKSITH